MKRASENDDDDDFILGVAEERKRYERRIKTHVSESIECAVGTDLYTLLHLKMLRAPIPMAMLATTAGTIIDMPATYDANYYAYLCDQVCRVFDSYRTYCLKTRYTFALCLLRRKVYKDMRVMLMTYLIRTEEQPARIQGVIGFCVRHFVPSLSVIGWVGDDNVSKMHETIKSALAHDK